MVMLEPASDIDMTHTDANYSKSMWQPASNGQVQHRNANQGIYETWHLDVLACTGQPANDGRGTY